MDQLKPEPPKVTNVKIPFSIGELIPLKGIFFRIVKVEEGGTISLLPVAITSKAAKKRSK